MKIVYEKPTAQVVNLAALAQLASGDPFAIGLASDDFFDDFSSGVDNERD